MPRRVEGCACSEGLSWLRSWLGGRFWGYHGRRGCGQGGGASAEDEADGYVTETQRVPCSLGPSARSQPVERTRWEGERARLGAEQSPLAARWSKRASVGVMVCEGYVNEQGRRAGGGHGMRDDGWVVAGRAGDVVDGEEGGAEAWQGSRRAAGEEIKTERTGEHVDCSRGLAPAAVRPSSWRIPRSTLAIWRCASRLLGKLNFPPPTPHVPTRRHRHRHRARHPASCPAPAFAVLAVRLLAPRLPALVCGRLMVTRDALPGNEGIAREGASIRCAH